jgi:hypothetical protein
MIGIATVDTEAGQKENYKKLVALVKNKKKEASVTKSETENAAIISYLKNGDKSTIKRETKIYLSLQFFIIENVALSFFDR